MERDVTNARQEGTISQQTLIDMSHVARVASLGQLSASIAHELVEPLTAIATTGEASLRWLQRPQPDIEKVHQGLQNMIVYAQRAAEIVHCVRALSKKSEPERVAFDLNQMLEDVLALIRSELMVRRVSLRLELQRGLPHVRGDRVQLQQVVLNLVINGIQAMADLDPTERVLRIGAMRFGEDQLVVEVGDSGKGIDAATAEHLFDPFFTTKREGIGLGLAISRSIIAAHEGQLWFTQGDIGPIFHIALPAG